MQKTYKELYAVHKQKAYKFIRFHSTMEPIFSGPSLREPAEYYTTNGDCVKSFDGDIDAARFLEALQKLPADKKYIISVDTYYGYDNTCDTSIQIIERIQKKNPQYKSLLKQYTKDSAICKEEYKIYTELQKAYEKYKAEQDLINKNKLFKQLKKELGK